ncbi:MAG: exodeoxyribonuclease VII large subunit [Bacillota bacterium]
MQGNINHITVSQFSNYIKNILAYEDMLQGIYILGEVSGVSHSGGNVYFTLKDEGAQVACCQFKNTHTYSVKNGERVLLFGSADYYAPWGKLSFIVRKVVPYGKGVQHEMLEKLKADLAKEGLFSESHKKSIPPFPHNICVVTSISGAVIEDIKSTIRRYNGYINICISDTKVQGVGASTQICDALKLADQAGFDAIILARGGGSFEDLMAFNDESVVRTIYAMQTPTISAVGHETDFTLCDFVADERALTPTAAAERVAFSEIDLKRTFSDKLTKAQSIIQYQLDSDLNKVRGTIKEIYHHSRAQLNKFSADISRKINIVGQIVAKNYAENEAMLNEKRTKLNALNPYKLMQSGYFKLTDSKGNPLIGVKKLQNGDKITITGSDGTVEAQIIREV